MSRVQAKPYIESVIGSLSDEQKSALKSLINGYSKTPTFRSLTNKSHAITTDDKGVKFVALEMPDGVETGYLMYTDTYCALASFHENTQEMNLWEIDVTGQTCERVDEELSILELRSTLFDEAEIVGMENPMTAAGDIIVGGTSGAPGRLAVGTEGQVLKVGSSGIEWGSDTAGMENPMTAANDLIVGGVDGAATRLAKGNNGELLRVNGSGNVAYGNNLPIITTAPSADNTDGLIICVLDSDPATKYDGYLYLITAPAQ